MKFASSQLLLLLMLVFTFSCKKSATPANSIKNNPFAGNVTLVNQNDSVSANNAGISVTVENVLPNLSKTTDANGNFSFGDISGADLVCLRFSYPGYGTVRQYFSASYIDSVKRGQKSFICNPVLVPQSATVITDLTLVSLIKNNDSSYLLNLNAKISVPNANATNGITIFLQKNNPILSFRTCTGQEVGTCTYLNLPVTNGDYNLHLAIKCSPHCFCVSSGDTVYVKAYGSSFSNFGTSYYDLQNKLMVFPTISDPNNVQGLSVMVP